jgi:tetratricopeptide (TPR) repeat protein
MVLFNDPQTEPGLQKTLIPRSESVSMRQKYIFLVCLAVTAAALPVWALGSEWEMLNARALTLYRAGKHKQAIDVAQQALKVAEKEGLDHPAVALSLNNLGLLHKARGDYTQAESAYLFALAHGEKARGANHPSVAKTLNNLAALYEVQGRYDKALAHYQRSLSIKEWAFGPYHLSVALSLNNLAGLYCKQGHYAQAEPLYRRALTIREIRLGLNHPLVAASLDNLASLYRSTNRDAAAIPYEQRAAAIRQTQP